MESASIWRDANGVPHIQGAELRDLFYGQGVVHATDRGLQLLMMRILGQGRAAEFLDPSNETVQIDTFFRRMNWAGNTTEPLKALTPEVAQCIAAYCRGINEVLEKHVPWELKLFDYRPEPWKPGDCVLISRMIGYLTLVQSQAELERLLIELVQAGVDERRLEELFPGMLGGLDLALLKQIAVGERIVPTKVLWSISAPRMVASNNWVVSGERTRSGQPMLANDPHLEVNRLPAVWNEQVLHSTEDGRFAMGGTMPGIPGVLIGRSRNLAWGATYSFLDAVDSWIERCRTDCYYREDGQQWHPFEQRWETIQRKKGTPLRVCFYENLHGVLDGHPGGDEEIMLLATRWAAAESGAGALTAVTQLWYAETTSEALATLAQTETGWNFVVAGADGDIGFQMTGRVPKRREGVSGLVPLPGWVAENDWQGFLDPGELPRVLNPEGGQFVTANQDLNRYGTASPQNAMMASYRADRIERLLGCREKLTLADMQAIQFDCYSLQAELFMPLLEPVLPDAPASEILRNWDLSYDPDSEGAFLFERFYAELFREVFGGAIGTPAFDHLWHDSGIFADFYGNFDRILLSTDSEWFGGCSREELFRRAASRALTNTTPRPWHTVNQFMMRHMLFGGKLPATFGFDRGPLNCRGGRATVHQGQLYSSNGRQTSFAPSYRLVCDLGELDLHTTLAGGPSDRRFSRWYTHGIDDWFHGRFKTLTTNPEQRIPFRYRDPEVPGPLDLVDTFHRLLDDLSGMFGGTF